MLEKLINEVYLKTINIVLNDIDEKDKDEISNNYLKYLYSMYSDKEITDDNYDRFLNVVVNLEQQKWQNRDKETRLYYFKKDESFEIIDNISKKAFSLASLRLEQNSDYTISKEEAEKNINILINQINNVEEFNKEEAKRLVSEGILDFEYASGKNDITSLRIGHLKK